MLTGLDLMFMGVTRSNSGLFSTPVFLVSPVGKREKREREKKKKEGNEGKREYKRKGRKEEGIKNDRRQDKNEF